MADAGDRWTGAAIAAPAVPSNARVIAVGYKDYNLAVNFK